MKLGFVAIEINHRLFGLCCYNRAVKDQIMSFKCSCDVALECVSIKGH